MKVFVTGSGSRLAAALLPKLCARPGIERVTGIDLDPPLFQHARLNVSRLDIRSPRLDDALAGHDALIHLACVRQQGGRSERDMFDINVNGGHKVFHAARRAGIKRLIHLSSAAVYGSGVHLGELAPLAARAGLAMARHWLGWSSELAWIEGLTRTLLVNCRRAAVELGWRSAHSAASALAQS